MKDIRLTEVELHRTVVPVRKDADGRLLSAIKFVLQKGTRLMLDCPMEYFDVRTGKKVKLYRFKTIHSKHAEFKNLNDEFFIHADFVSFFEIKSSP